MKRIVTVITFLLVQTVGALAAQDKPLLAYSWHGGNLQYKEVHVVILASGSARVTAQRHDAPPLDYRTLLTTEELSALRTLVRSTDFFSEPEGERLPPPTDVGENRLTVHLDGRGKSLTYGYRPALDPLTGFVAKLLNQAKAIDAIENDRDVYSAIGSVIPTHAAIKALQPAALKAPLMSYIRAHDDRQRVEWALQALSWLTTPEQFSGFVSRALEDRKQRGTVLGIIGTHPFCRNIPPSHLQALCPVHLTFVKDAYLRQDQLTQLEKEALEAFIRLIGETRYQPAIPVLLGWFERQKQPFVTFPLTPLAAMGISSLTALIPYLDSPEEAYRANAIELLTIASRSGPHAGFSNPLSEYEYGRMIPVFTGSVLPALRSLAQTDQSYWVKKRARAGIEEIDRHIKEASAVQISGP